jgi:hypothetical protein
MFNNSGLSLNQAPPIKVVLRFFIAGAFFGTVTAIIALIFGYSVIDEASSKGALIITHLLTLGVLASFMFGAIFQMLPVLCGVSLNAPLKASLRIQYTLLVGIIFLLAGFYLDSTINYIFALIFLTISIIWASYILLERLRGVQNHSNSSLGITLSVIALTFTYILGATLLSVRGGFDIDIDYLALKENHLSFGLFGWVAGLIISVAFQVIEMFYVTKPYPKLFGKYSTITILALLLIGLIYNAEIANYFIALILLAFALITTLRILKRKRKINDATVWFWLLGVSSLTLFAFLYLATIFIEIDVTFMGILFLYFATSIIFAMSYKIVPFLVWFHLNAQGYFNAPMMHEVIHPKIMRINFYIHLLSFALIVLSKYFESLYYLAVITFGVSFTTLFINIYRGWQSYLKTQKEGKKFTFPS